MVIASILSSEDLGIAKTISSFASRFTTRFYRLAMFAAFRGGKLFPRTPISALCRTFIGRGLRPCYRGGPIGPYLSAFGRQLFTARLRRATAEGLRFAAFDCVTFVPCRLLRLCRTMRFSHIRYAAPTALLCRAETFGAGRIRAATFGVGRMQQRSGPGEFGRQRSGSGESGRLCSGPGRVCLSCRSALVVTLPSAVKAMIKKGNR